jgi:galactose mutarotase-like enzyme
MYTLENDFLIVTIHPLGAELQRLYNKQTNTEILWSGDAAYWGKFSPVLFPIVGSLKGNTYYYNNKAYHLPRHGFAREKEFVVKNQTENSIVFSLTHSEATLKVYPFLFALDITYTLQQKELTCTYNVKNIGNDEMHFSIGAHPAFAVIGNYNDYYLQFNKDKNLVRYKLDNGLISDNTQSIALENNQLPLQHELFYDDAIVLKTLQSNQITLANKNNRNGLHFKCNDFPFFGIWATKDAPFICLEPWCGIADNTTHNQQLPKKEGMIKLLPNVVWERFWSIECF